MSTWAAALYLENGHLFEGIGHGTPRQGGGEVVFNTGMSGYQEIFTDPSYCRQIVVMTYPHIGNTGINSGDMESKKLWLSGVVAREFVTKPSNWRSEVPLGTYLEQGSVPVISDIDTRAITILLRSEGAQRGVIFPVEDAKGQPLDSFAKSLVEQTQSMEGLNVVREVSCTEPYLFEEQGLEAQGPQNGKVIVAYDYGIKTNTLREFSRRGFKVWVVPYDTSAKDVLARNPAAIVLSNGPGDPSVVDIEPITQLVGQVPIFAICMGHQLLARALGAATYKLKFGHHGVNHPVQDKRSGRIIITSQNHGFAVEASSLPSSVEWTHSSLNDNTVEGFVSRDLKLCSYQFHPEAMPGPADANYLFDDFVKGYVQ